jgi:hypothetical protein
MELLSENGLIENYVTALQLRGAVAPHPGPLAPGHGPRPPRPVPASGAREYSPLDQGHLHPPGREKGLTPSPPGNGGDTEG